MDPVERCIQLYLAAWCLIPNGKGPSIDNNRAYTEQEQAAFTECDRMQANLSIAGVEEYNRRMIELNPWGDP